MLRVNQENGNIYGFLGEGGHIDITDIEETYGEIILTIRGKEKIEKRELLFGQPMFCFILTAEDIEKIGVGSHPYSVAIIDKDGNKSTVIPDTSTGYRPTFNIEE